MRDEFSNYFSARSNENVQLKLNPVLLNLFNQFDIFPRELTHRVDSYQGKYIIGIGLVDAKTSVRLTFDFSREYDEFCLIHHQTGIERLSLNCLERLKLIPDLAAQIAQTIKALGPDYFAVHIRNTDYQTDYKVFFEAMKNEVRDNRLLVCSDDAACINFAKNFFGQTEILTVSNIPDTKATPLHYYVFKSGVNAFEINKSILIDLIALSLSKKLFISKLTNGQTSGFSMLAAMLNKRNDIVQSLLGICCP